MISDGSRDLSIYPQTGKTFAFVDADNVKRSLGRALKQLGFRDSEIDQFGVSQLLFSASVVNRFYIYSAIQKGDDAPNWIQELRANEGTIFRESLLTRAGKRKKQEGVDVRLALEAMSCAYKKTMETCVVFSDDGDLYPLINALVDEGFHTVVASFGNPEKSDVAKRMRDACDLYIHIGRSALFNAFARGLSKGRQSPIPAAELEDLGEISSVCLNGRDFLRAVRTGVAPLYLEEVPEGGRWYGCNFESENDAVTYLRFANHFR